MGVATSIWDAALSSLALIKAYLGTDEKQDAEPAHSAVYDVRAEDHNVIVAGLAECALRLRIGNVVGYMFSQPNCTASQTNVDLYRASGGDTALLFTVAPWAGSVVGLAVRVENARSAGTLTVKWTLGGAEQTLSVTIDGTNSQKHVATQLPGVETFALKDELGVSVTTDGTWAAGSTPSVEVELLVAYGE